MRRGCSSFLVFLPFVKASPVISGVAAAVGDNCLPDWAACSVQDDNALPCCDGLYCRVSNDYYAQCVAVTDDMADDNDNNIVPTPAPFNTQTTVSPTVGASGPYLCGNTVDDESDYVYSEYASWKQMYVVESDAGACINRPQQGNDCVSEGLGYGMILSASLNDQTLFDQLWSFSQYVFDSKGLPNWDLETDGSVIGYGSASDADIDIALGLLMAAAKWPNSSYLSDAKLMISNIMANDMDYSDTFMTLPGDGWEGPYPYNPSYFSPAHFDLFQQVTGDNRWSSAIDAGYQLLNNSCAAKAKQGSGLVPDWTASLTDCTAGNDIVIWDQDNGADYYYDAIRVPFRLSLHAAWTCDERAVSWLTDMSKFFNDQGVNGIDLGFQMDGTSLGGDDDTCFISTSAIPMLITMDEDTINTWWTATKGSYYQSGLYFCDTLRLLSLAFQAGLLVAPSSL